MPDSSSAEVVERYNRAFAVGDIATARSLLADDLHFKGPFEEFRNPDDYLSSLAKLAPIVTGTDVHKVLAVGEDVVTFYDLHTSTPAGSSPIAEWATVRGGKITRIQVFFDARPFAAMFESASG
jgi:ketosteroid isomerase-like protein